MLAYRADIDALSIEEQTGLPFASEHPGFMHACGHDMHMTIALGIIDHFVHHPVKHDLLFYSSRLKKDRAERNRCLKAMC